MAHEQRIQLHSGVGRLGFFAASVMWIGSLVSIPITIVLSLRSGRISPALFTLPIHSTLLFLLARWARRNATAVFASADGLELAHRNRTVGWEHVSHVADLGWLGGMLVPLYRVTFDDGTPALTFYACEDVERIVQRFKAPRPAALGQAAH
jgi:hypothetical protein